MLRNVDVVSCAPLFPEPHRRCRGSSLILAALGDPLLQILLAKPDAASYQDARKTSLPGQGIDSARLDAEIGGGFLREEKHCYRAADRFARAASHRALAAARAMA